MRRVVAVAVLVSTAHADPARDQEKAAAETLGNDGRRLRDPQRSLACGQAFIDLYNKDPVAPDFEDLLVKAAQCYDDARAIGPALIVYRLIDRYAVKQSASVGPALSRMGALYEQVGMLRQAAETFEKLATDHPTDGKAKPGLVEAIRIRGVLGDVPAHLKAIALFENNFGADVARAAELSLSALPQRARDRVSHLRAHVAKYGDKGGDELAARARAHLGLAIWETACPTSGIDGVCLDDPRPRPLPLAPRPLSRERCTAPTIVKRDPKLSEEARAQLAEADKRFARVAQPSAESQRVRAQIRLVLADRQFETGSAKAEAAYLALAVDQPVAAHARLGRRWQVLAFRSCERPDPALIARAIAAYDTCLAKASQLGVIDDWSRRCLRERAVLDPSTAPLTPELLPDAPLPMPLRPELPIAPGPNQRLPYKDALAKLARLLEQRPAECDALARTFLGLAKSDRRAEVPAMAGLAYAHCNQVVNARAAYAAALKLDPQYGLAHSGLAALDYRAGLLDAARTQWSAALKANGKLFGARLGLALFDVNAARSAVGPAKAKPVEEAIYQAANATAVHPQSSAPFVAMALAALAKHEPTLASYFAARAAAIESSPETATVQGAALAAAGEAGALAILQRASTTSPDAALALALHQLALRRYADAAATLAPIKSSTYEVLIARGVVARALGKLAEAEARYAEASLLDLKRPEAHWNLGVLAKDYIAARTKDPAVARAALGKAAAAFRRANLPEGHALADDCDKAAAQL